MSHKQYVAMLVTVITAPYLGRFTSILFAIAVIVSDTFGLLVE